MKKIIPLLSLALVSLALTGCFDVYQHLTLDSKQNIHVFTRITVSKALISMASGMSGGSAPTDYDSLLFDTTTMGETAATPGGTYIVRRISNDVDFGGSFEYLLKKDGTTVETAPREIPQDPFFPRFDNGTIQIELNTKKAKPLSDEESGQMAALFLSTAKYRLSLSKYVKKTVSSARLEVDGETAECNVADLFDEFLIEVPFALILEKDATLVIE